jgi:secretion/DNA translocation related TadE-like protein
MTTERGNVSVLMVVAVVLAGMLCVVLARVGAAAGDRARADTAADAAALAAADQLALGHGSTAAVDAARHVAAENGAVLVACICAGRSAQVSVLYQRFRARARAEVTQRAPFDAIAHNS